VSPRMSAVPNEYLKIANILKNKTGLVVEITRRESQFSLPPYEAFLLLEVLCKC
jgi:hypothetical protein